MDRKEHARADAKARLKAATQMKERADRLTGDNKLTDAAVIEAIAKFEKWNAMAKALYFYQYIMTMQWPTLMQLSEQTDKNRHKGKTEEKAYIKQRIKDVCENVVIKGKSLALKGKDYTIKENYGTQHSAGEVSLNIAPTTGNSYWNINPAADKVYWDISPATGNNYSKKDIAIIKEHTSKKPVTVSTDKSTTSNTNNYINANALIKDYESLSSLGNKPEGANALIKTSEKVRSLIKNSANANELKFGYTNTNSSYFSNWADKKSLIMANTSRSESDKNAKTILLYDKNVQPVEFVQSIIERLESMMNRESAGMDPTGSSNTIKEILRISSIAKGTDKNLFLEDSIAKELSTKDLSIKGLGIQKPSAKGLSITSINEPDSIPNLPDRKGEAIGLEDMPGKTQFGLSPNQTGFKKFLSNADLVQSSNQTDFEKLLGRDGLEKLFGAAGLEKLTGRAGLGKLQSKTSLEKLANEAGFKKLTGNTVLIKPLGKTDAFSFFESRSNEKGSVLKNVVTNALQNYCNVVSTTNTLQGNTIFNPAAQETKSNTSMSNVSYINSNAYTKTSQNASSSSNLYALTGFFDVRAQRTEASSFVGNGSKITQRPQAFISQFAKLYLPFTDIDNNETDRQHKLSAVSKVESDDRKILKSQMFGSSDILSDTTIM